MEQPLPPHSVELLVDADCHSIQEVRDSVTKLERKGYVVRTTVFAPPGRLKNKDWRALLAKPRMNFHEVERCGSEGEANDQAIETCCQKLVQAGAVDCIAVLASDKDFLGTMVQSRERGVPVMLLTSSINKSVIRHYRSSGVRVFELESRSHRPTRVRALLRKDGSGHVKLAQPFCTEDDGAEQELCVNFLYDLGYIRQPDCEYLAHATAKFWFRNAEGSLTVFPQQCATKAVNDLARNNKRSRWRRYSDRDGLGFILPVSSSVRHLTTKQQEIYGSSLAKQVFRGGGPFILKGADCLVQQALEKLGYLDTGMNRDLAEAVLTFVNRPANHIVLRKVLNVLPSSGDSLPAIREKLGFAFQSHLSRGRWSRVPSDASVRQMLCKQGLLDTVKEPASEVFRAMAKYARQHQLPEMKTYNGYVFRIARAFNSSPDSTALVEINPQTGSSRSSGKQRTAM